MNGDGGNTLSAPADGGNDIEEEEGGLELKAAIEQAGESPAAFP